MMRFRFITLAVFILFAAFPLAAQDSGDSADSPMLNLFRFVPNRPAYREWLQYGDLHAWYESWEFVPFESREALMALEGTDDRAAQAFLWVMGYQVSPPDVFSLQTIMDEDLHSVYGFDIFTARRMLMAGLAPEEITVIEHTAESTGITDSLESVGYETESIEGGTLYSRSEANEATLQEMPISRAVQLGNLNRIALLDALLVTARSTEVVESALEAEADEIPSLADDAAYRALATVLEGDELLAETGELTGAIIVAASQVSAPALYIGVPGVQPDVVNTYYEETGALPPYMLAAFATRHKPGTTYQVIALVFPQSVDGDAAAETLEARIRNYTSYRFRMPFSEILERQGARIEFAAATEAEGLPVALLVIADDDPTFEKDELGMRQTAVFSWWQFITSRDTMFLAVTEE